MNCVSEGVLRTYGDGAMNGTAFEEVKRHLENCGPCRLELEQLTMDAANVKQLLGTLKPAASFAAVDAAGAYDAFRTLQRDTRRGGKTIVPRGVWAGLAAACVAVTVLAFAPTRGWAQHILEMLRIQRVAIVPVNMSDIAAEGGHGKLAAQFLSDNVVITMKSGKPVAEASVADASTAAGFAVRTIADLTVSDISVSGAAAFHMTLDRERVEALLDAAGREDLALPANVDGSTVAVYVPKSVRMKYGEVGFAQVPTPTVSLSKSLDMALIAEVGLQVAGMSAAEAHAFCTGVDWTSTLVIPIPQAHSSYRTVTVDGVNGTLIEVDGTKREKASALLVWVKDGVVYSLNADSADRVLAAAGSLS